MSRRTEELTVGINREELRAHARSERHRITTELHAVEGWRVEDDPDIVSEVSDPGVEWKPVHHHDATIAKKKLASGKRNRRHWKMKEWKRRTVARRQRVLTERALLAADD